MYKVSQKTLIMTKYRLSEGELINIVTSYSTDPDQQNGYIDGVQATENRLIPLLEQRDALLADCRDFISLVAGHPDFQKERKELLNKLQSIK